MKQKIIFFLKFTVTLLILLVSFPLLITSCDGNSDTDFAEKVENKNTSIESNPFEGKWRRVKTEYSNEIVWYEDKNFYHIFSLDGKYTTEGYSKDISETDECTYSFDSQYLIIYYHPELIDTFKYKFIENGVLEYSWYNANHDLGVAFRQSVETLKKVN